MHSRLAGLTGLTLCLNLSLIACGEKETGVDDTANVEADADTDADSDTDTDTDTDTDADTDSLEIMGTWTDGWGTHDIGADTWSMGYGQDVSLFHYAWFSNAERTIIAENDAGNTWAGGLWSRFDWTYDAGDLYYCQPIYDAADQAAAEASTAADPENLANGCAGFSWSALLPAQGR